MSEPIPAFRNGVWVCKPNATPGQNIPDYEGGYITTGDGAGCPDIDAPMLKFMHLEDKWQVHGQDSAGGLGSADFINEWSTADEAVKDILDFYFGDPSRMAKKAAEIERRRVRTESSKFY